VVSTEWIALWTLRLTVRGELNLKLGQKPTVIPLRRIRSTFAVSKHQPPKLKKRTSSVSVREILIEVTPIKPKCQRSPMACI